MKFLIGFACLLFSCSDGYVINRSDGTVSWVTYGGEQFKNEYKLHPCDASKFVVFDFYIFRGRKTFGSDGQRLFIQGKVATGIDPTNFKNLGFEWFSDGEKIYYYDKYGVELRDVDVQDPEMFNPIDEFYGNDDQCVYMGWDQKICEDTISGWTPISPLWNFIGEKVYWLDSELPDVKANCFSVDKDFPVYGYCGNDIYWQGKRIPKVSRGQVEIVNLSTIKVDGEVFTLVSENQLFKSGSEGNVIRL